MGSLSSQLVQREIATIKQVEDALARQVLYGGDLLTNLLEVTGPDREGAITYVLAEHLALPPAPAGELPPATAEAKDRLPPEVALSRGIAVLSVESGALRVATSEALGEDALRELEFVAEMPISQLAAPAIRIKQAHARDHGVALDRRTARLLARLGGRPDPHPSTRPPPMDGPRFPRAFSPETTSLRSDLPPPPSRPAAPSRTTSLVRWALGTPKEAPEPRRRRRGPFTIPDAEDALFGAAGPEVVREALFDFARQYFTYTALFVVHGDIAEGREASGPGAGRAEVVGVGVPLGQESILAESCSRRAPVCRRLATSGIDAELAKDLRRPERANALVVPVLVKDRPVLLLYGDDGDEALNLGEVSEVLSMSGLAGGAIERILRAKRKGEGKSKPPATPAHREPTQRAPSETHAEVEGNLVSALAGLADAQPSTPPAEPPAREPAPDSTPVVEAKEADPAEDSLLRAALAEIEVPSAATEESIPMSRASYHPPATVPPVNDAPKSQSALPSVILEVDPTQRDAVDALLADGADETEAMGEILRRGAELVPTLLGRLPGPLSVSIDGLVRGEARPSQAGVLFRALAALRRAALPFVVVQSANADPKTRVIASLALAEFAYPESAGALVARLFDPEESVREAARTACRWLRASPDTFGAVTGQLARIVASTMERVARRVAAAESLGEIGAKDAVGGLLKLGESDDERLSNAALAALGRLTHGDRDLEGHRKFWKRHGSEDPALWAIAALESDDPRRIEHAVRELVTLGIEAKLSEAGTDADRRALAERAREAVARRGRSSSARA